MHGGLLLAAVMAAATMATGPSAAAEHVGLPQCADGTNNDPGDDGYHDGADFPLDPDCESPLDDRERGPACSDHIDNDRDGRTDHEGPGGPGPEAADPGCDGPDDDSEGDVPACADGLDNDGDGRTDYPADAGCETPEDPEESSCQVADPAGCGGPSPCADPLPPMGLRASQGPGGVLLEWQAPLSGPLVAYLVYRLEVSGAPVDVDALVPHRLAATAGHETSYLDQSASEGGTYVYWVAAAGSGCQSASSAPAGVGTGIIDLADCFYIQNYELPPNGPDHTDPSLNCLPLPLRP